MLNTPEPESFFQPTAQGGKVGKRAPRPQSFNSEKADLDKRLAAIQPGFKPKAMWFIALTTAAVGLYLWHALFSA